MNFCLITRYVRKLFDIHPYYKLLFSLVILCLKYIPASLKKVLSLKLITVTRRTTSLLDTTDLSLLKDWECSGSIQVLRVRAFSRKPRSPASTKHLRNRLYFVL